MYSWYPYVSVCRINVLVCYSYVTRMYSYVAVCIVYYSYVTRMLLVVLVWSFSQDPRSVSYDNCENHYERRK